MTDRTKMERAPPMIVVHLLEEALRVTDTRLNQAAQMLVSFTGAALHRELIDGALAYESRPPNRARLLRAVAMTRTPLDADCLLDVGWLTNDRSPEVRAAAAELLGHLPDVLTEERAAARQQTALRPNE